MTPIDIQVSRSKVKVKGQAILYMLGKGGISVLQTSIFWIDSCALFDFIRWLKPSSPDKYISAHAHYYYTSHIMLLYTCVTPCIFTSNYLRCLNACQWRYGLQTIFRTWLTRESILFNYLIDGYCHLLFICYTLITQYYHNITQLDVK